MALFNVRVYGILLDQQKRLLVSDEFAKGHYFTKLPGGGLEIGEGTRACLAREFEEETGLSVHVQDHFYTTDFYQLSAFNKLDQVISIYYYVHCEDTSKLKTSTIPFDFLPEQVADAKGEAESFRWIEWDAISAEIMSLPIDKVAIKLLKDQF